MFNFQDLDLGLCWSHIAVGGIWDSSRISEVYVKLTLFFFKYVGEFANKPSLSGVFFVVMFLIEDSISLTDTTYWDFSITSCVSLGNLCFSIYFPILL